MRSKESVKEFVKDVVVYYGVFCEMSPVSKINNCRKSNSYKIPFELNYEFEKTFFPIFKIIKI